MYLLSCLTRKVQYRESTRQVGMGRYLGSRYEVDGYFHLTLILIIYPNRYNVRLANQCKYE